jgi:hypothetical protein
VDQVGSIMRSADETYAMAAWRTLGQARVQVTWVLRSMYDQSCISTVKSRATLRPISCSSSLSFKDGACVLNKRSLRCVQDGVNTCGLAFCSDTQAPKECIFLPKLLVFVKRVLEVCVQRWSMNERDRKEQCAGLTRLSSDDKYMPGLQDDSLHSFAGFNDQLWTFVLKVSDNPSLLKLISYGMWHHVMRSVFDDMLPPIP